MAERPPIESTNLDIYGNPEIPWSRARDILATSSATPDVTYFLGTVGPHGRPHAAGLGALWLDGDLYFTSGPAARKTRHLEANPACTLSARLQGIDVVLEGDAVRVTNPETLEAVARGYREAGWPAQVAGDALTAPYSAPSAGPAPWYVYRLAFHTVYGVATAEPYGATRWRFS